MNDFDKYYNRQFRQDIHAFFSKIPERSKHTFDDRKVFTVQYQVLTKDFDYLNFLDKEKEAYFGTALFFLVLVDQVCYSHYLEYYNKFESLTRYPKFVGNSPSTDRTNFPPKDIFKAFNYSRDKERMLNSENIEFREAFSEAKQTMKNETIDFFKNYLNEINGEEFWKKCEQELPFHP